MSPLAHFLVHFAFFYTCVEGLVINILYPAKLPFIYKDLVLFLIYAGVLLPNPETVLNPPPIARVLSGTLVLFIGMFAVYMLVPSPMTVLSELVAVKQRVFYIPLTVVAYYFVRSTEDLKWLITAMAVYAIGVSLFGIYLFFIGPEGLQRIGGTYAAVFYTPTGASGVSTWRVPGTFTSAGQYGSYLMFNAVVIGGLAMIPRVRPWIRMLLVASLAFILLALLTSGSRAPIVVATTAVALSLMMSGRPTKITLWVIVAYAILAYGFVLFGPGVQDRFGSIASAEHIERFQRTYFGQLFLSSLIDNPLGAGLGVATIGARHFAEFYQVVLVESYFGIMSVETGWPGLLTILAVVAAVLTFVFQHRRSMASSPNASLWLALASYVVLTIMVMPVSTTIDNAPTNFYFWFSIGALIRLVELEYWRQWESATGARPVWITPGADQEPASAATST